MDDIFVKHAQMNGEVGRKWLQDIPETIKQYEKAWSITVRPPFNLNYNYVAPALDREGREVVLKIGFPTDREFVTEMDALEVFHGDGIVKLLNVDMENKVILLERLRPGEPLSRLDDDDEATRILARVMKKLWKPLPSSHSFISIREWKKDFIHYKKDLAPKNLIPLELVSKAEQMFDELLVTSEEEVLLHGDLHQDNVLSSIRDSWLAIDPKGYAGEAVYDVAAMIRNPYEKLKEIKDLEPLLTRRMRLLSDELGFSLERIYKWCFTQTVISAIWNAEGVKGPEHAVRVAQVLDKISF